MDIKPNSLTRILKLDLLQIIKSALTGIVGKNLKNPAQKGGISRTVIFTTTEFKAQKKTVNSIQNMVKVESGSWPAEVLSAHFFEHFIIRRFFKLLFLLYLFLLYRIYFSRFNKSILYNS